MILDCPSCAGPIDCKPVRRPKEAICPHCDQPFHLPRKPPSRAPTILIRTSIGLLFISTLVILYEIAVSKLSKSQIGQIGDIATWVVGLGLIAAIYFLPTLIAISRKHRNGVAIFFLNAFAGWTFLGWVAAFVWSLYEEKQNA